MMIGAEFGGQLLKSVALNFNLSLRGTSVCSRNLSFYKFRRAYQNYFRSKPTGPPYRHTCQVGDPVLRACAEPVDPTIVTSEHFQTLLAQMISVMRKYKAVGLAAPQIGVSSQIFVMEVTQKNLDIHSEEIRRIREMREVPLTIFVNPILRVRDYTALKFPEGCLSVLGYTAEVSRSKSVTISALDAYGKPFTWEASGWPARIAQHETDHLQGKLFVDKMNPTTFTCTGWHQVNQSGGLTELRYCAR